MKKTLSIILSIVIATSTFGMFATSTQAASYREQLLAQGFTVSYVEKLVELHNQYPNWEFRAFNTDLEFDEAVKGELKGTPTSEANLREYLDPRNWLNEKYIFQFESIKLGESSQSKAGVEGILSGTWMHNSLISYKTTSGAEKIYSDSTKYSDAMIKASKDSGLSAYYVASKIKQENGSSNSTATAVCGTKAPFQGIYNYYNIGAYTCASDGLAWAAGFLTAKNDCLLYPSYDKTTKKPTGEPVKIKKGQRMTWRNTMDSGFYYVRLYSGESKKYTEGASGYIAKDDCNLTYQNKGRPWTNPYKSIYNGAKFIADGYLKYQYTMYLQKYNVNKDSGALYSHEYMTNVNGAANEAYHLYIGYTKAGVMSSKHVFYIPIYKNIELDESGCPYIYNLKQSANSTTSVTLSWSRQEKADGYKIFKYNSSKKEYTEIAKIDKNTTCKYKVSNLKAGTGGYYSVAAYIMQKDVLVDGTKCENVYTTTKPAGVKNLKVVAQNGGKIKVSWSKLSGNGNGYQICWAKDKAFKNVIAKTDIKKLSTLSYTGKNFTKKRTYYVKIRAYKKANGKTYYGSWSSAKKVVAK